jgi:hypothetical protein
MATETELYEAEVDLLLEKVGRVSMKSALVAQMQEGAWTGSHGGHDTKDFNKLRGGLKEWWIKTVRVQPHPFTYCVRHLAKHVADPERLCAWLKDQAMGTTKWRKGNKGNLKESEAWVPSLDELRAASAAFVEAEDELDNEIERMEDEGGAGASANAGGEGDDSQKAGEQPGSEGTEAGGEGNVVSADDEAKPTGNEEDE